MVVALGVLIVLIVAVQGLAGFYANFLWFHWSGVGDVWTTVTTTKVLLTLTFLVIAFALCFVSLWVVDKVVSRTLFMAPDTELVRRFQAVVGPHALALRIAVSILVALALGSSTGSQWQNWILFEHAVPFHQFDPIFKRDLSFFIFRMPFLSFLVDWIFRRTSSSSSSSPRSVISSMGQSVCRATPTSRRERSRTSPSSSR